MKPSERINNIKNELMNGRGSYVEHIALTFATIQYLDEQAQDNNEKCNPEKV